MIHSRADYPRIFPWNSARVPEQINRAQTIGDDQALTQTDLYEIGRYGKLGIRKETPKFTYTLKQSEYGNMEFFRALANKVDPATGDSHVIDLEDMSTTYFDIASYLTDENGTFRGTVHFPRMRLNGFSIDIGSPDASIERNFNLVGEDYKIMDGKYFAYADDVVGVLGTGEDYALHFGDTNEPVIPILHALDSYIFTVLRIRNGVCTELFQDATGTTVNTWKYVDGTKLLTVLDCLTGDLIKVYYEADSTNDDLWEDNNDDSDIIMADCCTILLKVGIGAEAPTYRLQSVNIDVALTRADYKEIGNSLVVQSGVKSKKITVKLGRILEDFTLEEVLRGTSAYPYIDSRNLADDITVIVKIYSDSTKTTDKFVMGYKITDLTPSAIANDQPVEDYATANCTLESDNLSISDVEDEI